MSRAKRDRTLASSKDQSPVRGARRENNDVRNGIPERKVPVIGNLSLPILPSLFSLAAIHSRCEAAGRRSIVPWHPWENRIREPCASLPQRERTRSDKNLIREKDKHDEKEELVRFYSREDTMRTEQRVYIRGFFFQHYHSHNQVFSRFSLYDL